MSLWFTTQSFRSFKAVHFLTFCKPRPASSRLTEDSGTAYTQDNGLGMTEYGSDLITSRALYVHKVRVRVLHKPLQLVFPLLFFRPGVK